MLSVSSFGKLDLSDGDGDGDGGTGSDTTPNILPPTEGGVCDINECYNCDNDGANTGCTAVGCLWDDTDYGYGDPPYCRVPNDDDPYNGSSSGGLCMDEDACRCDDGEHCPEEFTHIYGPQGGCPDWTGGQTC